MKELTNAFDSAISDLQTINWSETDGSDVKKILVSAFKLLMNHKPEIIRMFEETSSLNKFQKIMIKDILLKL